MMAGDPHICRMSPIVPAAMSRRRTLPIPDAPMPPTGNRNRHSSTPRQKEAILPEDLVAMLETLDRGTLPGLRDRAMPLVGFAGPAPLRNHRAQPRARPDRGRARLVN